MPIFTGCVYFHDNGSMLFHIRTKLFLSKRDTKLHAIHFVTCTSTLNDSSTYLLAMAFAFLFLSVSKLNNSVITMEVSP